MKFNKKMRNTFFAMAAASSFATSLPVYGNELTETREAVIESKGFIGGLASASENKSMETMQMGLVEKDGKTYCLDEFGQKVTGHVTIDDNTYFFNEEGVMQTGFVKTGGETYYHRKADGVMLTGVIHLNQQTYFLEEDGRMLSGWEQVGDNWVYHKEDGWRYMNEIVEIDGKTYSFNEEGIMETNVTRQNYNFDENGVGHFNGSAWQRIADAALAQLGVYQDCTMLVTNSLRAVGINFHGWPHEYLSLGPLTNNPVPGDIVVYQGHVAIYIGNGQAVHGGFNGNQTVVWSVNCANPLVGFVHPILP